MHPILVRMRKMRGADHSAHLWLRQMESGLWKEVLQPGCASALPQMCPGSGLGL